MNYYDRWKTTTPMDKAHDYGSCQCEDCHDFHRENGEMFENYDDADRDCCTDEVDGLLADGECCPDKIQDHGDGAMIKGRCHECLYENRTSSNTALLRLFWVAFYKWQLISTRMRYRLARIGRKLST